MADNSTKFTTGIVLRLRNVNKSQLAKRQQTHKDGLGLLCIQSDSFEAVSERGSVRVDGK